MTAVRRRLSLPAAALAATAALLTPPPAPAQGEECALALILALDVSGSVDPGEWRLQTEGLAQAFRSPELGKVILALDGALHVSVTQWTGTGRQRQALEWAALRDPADIAAFAGMMQGMARSWRHFSTAIGEAIQHAVAVGRAAPPDCRRKVIDVSGDGVSNEGVAPRIARQAAMAEGWVINGLAIQGAEESPAEHYRREVIAGPGAFVEVAADFDDYPRAILRKLLREIHSNALVASR